MKKHVHISAAIIARDEEHVIGECLQSLAGVADEIVVAIDDATVDKTEDVALKNGARIIHVHHQSNFDVSKQQAIDACTGEWILLLDADERLSTSLQKELPTLVDLNIDGQNAHQAHIDSKKKRVYDKHLQVLAAQGKIVLYADTDPIVAYVFPRLNLFINKYLRFGGIYPDGVIRFFKKGKAHFETNTLHEQLTIDGRVGWTEGELLHQDSPTFRRYIKRWYRYIDFLGEDLQREHLSINPITAIDWCVVKPIRWFILTYVIRRGFLDGWQGFFFCFFSSLRFAGGYYLFSRKPHKQSA